MKSTPLFIEFQLLQFLIDFLFLFREFFFFFFLNLLTEVQVPCF